MSQALESDNAYFELGANFQDLPGFRLVWAPGLEEIAAGCLAVRADVTAAETDPKGWVDTCEFALAKAGPAAYRVHVDGESPRLDEQLSARGYTKIIESAFLSPAGQKPEPGDATLRPVSTWPEWNLLCLLERECRRQGASCIGGDPLLWEELQRRKWITGRLRCFLIECGESVCGAASVLESGTLLRIASLAIGPGCGKSSLAEQAVRALWRMGIDGGNSAVSAMASGPLADTFRAAGLREAGRRAAYARPC